MKRGAASSRPLFLMPPLLPLQPDEAADVIGEVGHADLHFRPRDPNGSRHQRRKSLLIGEDVLNRRADPRRASIASLFADR